MMFKNVVVAPFRAKNFLALKKVLNELNEILEYTTQKVPACKIQITYSVFHDVT